MRRRRNSSILVRIVAEGTRGRAAGHAPFAQELSDRRGVLVFRHNVEAPGSLFFNVSMVFISKCSVNRSFLRMEPVQQGGVPEESGANRRRARRQRVLKKALIVFNDGHCSMGCQILDRSDVGAKLAPADIFLCPGEFILRPSIGEPRYCEIVWRRGANIGVRFL